MGSQRVGDDWATELSWAELNPEPLPTFFGSVSALFLVLPVGFLFHRTHFRTAGHAHACAHGWKSPCRGCGPGGESAVYLCSVHAAAGAESPSHCSLNQGRWGASGEAGRKPEEPQELQTGSFSPDWHRSRSSRHAVFSCSWPSRHSRNRAVTRATAWTIMQPQGPVGTCKLHVELTCAYRTHVARGQAGTLWHARAVL